MISMMAYVLARTDPTSGSVLVSLVACGVRLRRLITGRPEPPDCWLAPSLLFICLCSSGADARGGPIKPRAPEDDLFSVSGWRSLSTMQNFLGNLNGKGYCAFFSIRRSSPTLVLTIHLL